MGSKLITACFLALLILPLRAGADSKITDDQITVKKFRTPEGIVEQFCYVQTGGGNSFNENCGAPSQMTKLDVIYVAKSFGDRVLAHLQSAHAKNYYKNVSKVDLFHGHFIAKGPQTHYASAAAWLNDVEMTLYHSAEYLHEVWKDLEPGEEIYEEHATERSFAGFTKGEIMDADAAINFILPGIFLKSYSKAGTIYAEELNESLKISSHKLSTFGGNEGWYIENSCDPTDTQCKPCEIFNMMFIMPDPKGRFTTPDGAQVEIFFHCKFRD